MTRNHRALLSSLIAAGLTGGCGGGGSDEPETPTSAIAVVPPANGSYAGTYTCANTNNDATFTAVLPTATGAFSSCQGDVDSHTVKITCTGSITADGSFTVDGIDTNGITSVAKGVAGATTVTGTVTTSSSASSPFTCTH